MFKKFDGSFKKSLKFHHPFFSSVNRSTQAQANAVPESSWKLKRLRNSNGYCNNIPSYQGSRADPRFIEPRYVLYAKCNNPAAIFDDLILARHKNRIAQFAGKELLSFIVAARSFVGVQFLNALKREETQYRVLLDYTDDARIRVGFTSVWDDLDTLNRMLKLINIIHELEPFPSVFMNELPSFMRNEFNETEPLSLIEMEKDGLSEPTYFKCSAVTVPFGCSFSNYREDDHCIRTELPLIHQAILENNQILVDALLHNEPELANIKDPWGIKASELALELGPLAIYESLVLAKKHCPIKSLAELNSRAKEPHILHTWRETGYNMIVRFGADPNEESTKQHFAKARLDYEKIIQSPIPKRSTLHLSCIEGKIASVKEILNEAPQRLNEQDPRGYTPLLLAAANGHAKLVAWLLSQGASHQNVESPLCAFSGGKILRLIDNAATPEVIQVILTLHYTPNELHERLLLAIRGNDVQMARYISYYLEKRWPKFKGMNALELAVSLSERYGAEMVKTLLMFHDEPVPEGPYDEHLKEHLHAIVTKAKMSLSFIEDIRNISPEVSKELRAHNLRLHQKDRKKYSYVKFMSDELEGRQLITQLCSDKLSIALCLKPVADLTEAETNKIKALFCENFEVIKHNGLQAYLQDALADDTDKARYINLFYDKEELIAFFTFEIFEVDGTTVFHAKLAANLNEDEYSSQRLLAIALRPMAAIKLLKPDTKLVLYAKPIFPGLGLMALLPELYTEFYPKNQKNISESFVKKIVFLTGEKMVDGKIMAKLRLHPKNKRALNPMNPLLNYFSDAVGKDEVEAMALCYEVRMDFLEKFVSLLASHHINLNTINDFAPKWEAFYYLTSPEFNTMKARL